VRHVTIYTTDKEYKHFIELARNLQYVKKIETDEEEPTEEDIRMNLRKGFEEMQQIKKGKKTDNFKKEAKKLIRKYASLKGEIIEFGNQL